MLEQMINFLRTDAFRALSSDAQVEYLRQVYLEFRREFPERPDPMMAVLLAGMLMKAREQVLRFRECEETVNKV